MRWVFSKGKYDLLLNFRFSPEFYFLKVMRFLEEEWHFQSLENSCKRMLFQLLSISQESFDAGTSPTSFPPSSQFQVQNNNCNANFSDSGILSWSWFVSYNFYKFMHIRFHHIVFACVVTDLWFHPQNDSCNCEMMDYEFVEVSNFTLQNSSG